MRGWVSVLTSEWLLLGHLLPHQMLSIQEVCRYFVDHGRTQSSLGTMPQVQVLAGAVSKLCFPVEDVVG
jgi:hypothetical protein